MFLGTISPIPYGPDHPKYTKHPDHPDLYPTKYPGEKTPNVTRYPTQPTEYVTRYPGETTPYKGQPVYPVEPSHFQCPMYKRGYIFDSEHTNEFVLEDAGHNVASDGLDGSGTSFTSKEKVLFLSRKNRDDWFSIFHFSFDIKYSQSFELIFVGKDRKVLKQLNVIFLKRLYLPFNLFYFFFR